MSLVNRNGRPAPAGLTLVELLIAMTIVVTVVGTLAGLGQAVHMGAAFSEQTGIQTQHARVTLERIARHVRRSHTNNRFPGFLVIPDMVSGHELPETLVVWSPEDEGGNPIEPADPEGLPRFNELVVISPAPTSSNGLWELWELRFPKDDVEKVPEIGDWDAWREEIDLLKQEPESEVVLTDQVQTVAVAETGGQPRAAVRFDGLLRPSDDELENYRDKWEDAPWVQGLYGPNTGLRQAWLRIELQLGRDAPTSFFGSATRYYSVRCEER